MASAHRRPLVRRVVTAPPTFCTLPDGGRRLCPNLAPVSPAARPNGEGGLAAWMPLTSLSHSGFVCGLSGIRALRQVPGRCVGATQGRRRADRVSDE